MIVPLEVVYLGRRIEYTCGSTGKQTAVNVVPVEVTTLVASLQLRLHTWQRRFHREATDTQACGIVAPMAVQRQSRTVPQEDS